MLKEIFEQPGAIVKSVSPRIVNGLPNYSCDGISEDFWRSVKNIQIVACGSAIHAGIVGGKIIEEFAKIPTNVYIASEYRYNPPIALDGTLVIVISQSGETADTLAALRYAKSQGLPTLAVVNAVETSIAREADKRVYTYAGPEIAVATTKGYCTQLSELYLLAVAMGCSKGVIDTESAKELVYSISTDAPKAVSEVLGRLDEIKNVAKKLCGHEHIFYIGRGIDYALSMEASLKLKEISYIHCEAYAAGELKHGTISLVDQGTPVIALSTTDELFDKTESNVREVKSRGAFVVQLCKDNVPDEALSADEVIKLPSTSRAATLFASMVTVQLLAYETASLLGCDIDRPRNLAKSVTVE
jgi:glucosamine--fructose-6-phosphate aminotransferase (isomerizing)